MELPIADETVSKLNWNDKNLRYNHREDTTVWTLIFAVLNFRGFRGSTAIRESLVPRKFRPALTGQRITSILNSDVIILQNGYRGLGRSEHRRGVASNRLCEQTHEILLGT